MPPQVQAVAVRPSLSERHVSPLAVILILVIVAVLLVAMFLISAKSRQNIAENGVVRGIGMTLVQRSSAEIAQQKAITQQELAAMTVSSVQKFTAADGVAAPSSPVELDMRFIMKNGGRVEALGDPSLSPLLAVDSDPSTIWHSSRSVGLTYWSLYLDCPRTAKVRIDYVTGLGSVEYTLNGSKWLPMDVATVVGNGVNSVVESGPTKFLAFRVLQVNPSDAVQAPFFVGDVKLLRQ